VTRWIHGYRCAACSGRGMVRVPMPAEERRARLAARRVRLEALRRTSQRSYLRYKASPLPKRIVTRTCACCGGGGFLCVLLDPHIEVI